MNIRWFGAILVGLGCTSFGFSLAASYRREAAMLRNLYGVLVHMESELTYRMTPLPMLFRSVSESCTGILSELFRQMADEMAAHTAAHASDCVNSVLWRNPALPGKLRCILLELGNTLGTFDLSGQLRGIRLCQEDCSRELDTINRHLREQIRSYRLLGCCAGAALAILLL